MNVDLDWALNIYGAFGRGGPEERIIFATIPGAPWSKSRPRFARGRTYQPAADAKAEAQTRTHLAELNAPQFRGNVLLVCRFYRPNAQRIDSDNLLKHVCDSGTGVLWEDDSQVTLTIAEVMHDPNSPRTVVLAGAHESTLLRGDDRAIDCAHCERPFLPANKDQRFCSKPCAHAGRVTALRNRPCVQCGNEFHPITRTQKLCSDTCRRAFIVARNQINGRPKSTCTECGTQLTHNRGGRCRPCWRANPRMYTTQGDAP